MVHHEFLFERFDSGSVLPIQFFGSRRPVRGELRLMLAVLDEALHCVAGRPTALGPKPGRNPHTGHVYDYTTGARDEQRRDALRWMLSDDASWPFSFVNICEALGFSTEAIRTVIRRSVPSEPCRYRVR